MSLREYGVQCGMNSRDSNLTKTCVQNTAVGDATTFGNFLDGIVNSCSNSNGYCNTEGNVFVIVRNTINLIANLLCPKRF